MLRALYTSASGMQAQQMNLDVIANNLANVNTTGFKKSKVEFQDLLYQTNRAAGSEAGAGNQVPTSLQVGHGAHHGRPSPAPQCRARSRLRSRRPGGQSALPFFSPPFFPDFSSCFSFSR